MKHGVLALTSYIVHIADNTDSLSAECIVYTVQCTEYMEHEEPVNYVRNLLKAIIIILFD